jgi:hypothetical protein
MHFGCLVGLISLSPGRRSDGSLSPAEQSIPEEILADLIADSGGEGQHSTCILSKWAT